MANNQNTAELIHGPITPKLVKLTIPMLFGIMGMVVFNLVDTIYIGRIGTAELAALSFTFPVVMVVTSLGLGIGVGASSLISYTIGEGNQYKVQRLTSDSLVLSTIIVVIFVAAGLLTIDPLFKALGASPEVLPLVREYMEIWYLGVPFVIIPMVGNNALRAKGDMKTPAAIMLVIVIINIILDPLLIFGLGPFPELGLKGAAIATVIARALSLIMGLYILHFRDNMLTYKSPGFAEVMVSWKNILSIALPAAGAKMIVPLGIGIITRLISTYGHAPVAAFGAATRAEFFMLAIVMALGSVLNPFVGQNVGANQVDRAQEALTKGMRFALLWGLGSFVILYLIARPVALMFSTEEAVVENIILYLHIVPIGYAARGVFDIIANVLNVLRKPMYSAGLIFMHMIVFIVPFTYLGAYIYDIPGIFMGFVLANIMAGVIANYVLKHQFKKVVKMLRS